MMKKVIAAIVMISILTFYLITLYEYIPQDPVSLSAENIMPDPVAAINYGITPVFAENLRFNHNNISYFIEGKCSATRRKSMEEAFEIFEKEMRLISFYETNFNPDILVECSDAHIPLGDNLFAAGEGGPSRIINTSFFKTIEQGKIALYEDQRCNYPIVELHELLHVFGFDHVENPNSIMYYISECNQRMTSDMVKTIDDLYSIEPLPDASIGNLTATKRGKYLDFNITVLNEGLLDIDDINLSIVVDNEIVQVINMERLEIGYGRNLEAKNVMLPSTRIDNIIFELDKENSVREMREGNNIRNMSA